MCISETKTENIFRSFYFNDNFIEKSAIPSQYGFKSKKGTDYVGYPDFFLDSNTLDFTIVVEAKALKHSQAEEEVQWYMGNNKINETIVIAISGQELSQIKVTYFYKTVGGEIENFRLRINYLH